MFFKGNRAEEFPTVGSDGLFSGCRYDYPSGKG